MRVYCHLCMLKNKFKTNTGIVNRPTWLTLACQTKLELLPHLIESDKLTDLSLILNVPFGSVHIIFGIIFIVSLTSALHCSKCNCQKICKSSLFFNEDDQFD